LDSGPGQNLPQEKVKIHHYSLLVRVCVSSLEDFEVC